MGPRIGVRRSQKGITMKIAILAYSSPIIGRGHIVRSTELARYLHNVKEHDVWVLGNEMFHKSNYFQCREGESDDLYHVFHQVRPDWIVVDMRQGVPDYVKELSQKFNVSVLNINGTGRSEEGNEEITIIQGAVDDKRDNVFAGTEWVILRQEIFDIQYQGGKSWFVYGDSGTPNLLNMFNKTMFADSAMLMISPHSKVTRLQQNDLHTIHAPIGKTIFPFMTHSRAACVMMGMIAWELAVIGVPTYVFSSSSKHLHFAQAMGDKGFVKAYPHVGIPSRKRFVGFLGHPFIQKRDGLPDGKACERIEKLMREKTK